MPHKKGLVLLSVLFLLLVFSLPLSAQDDEFVFGVVLVGPANDHGWSQAHTEGGRYVEENVPGSRMLLFESLNPADAPESTLLSVVTEMVNEGAQLIFTTSDAFEEDTNTVAEAFPNVVFINTTGSNVIAEDGAPPNVGNYNGQMEWAKEIVGCAAALTTQTGSIGYLGPLINPETRRHAASVYLGARYCYENYAGGDPDELQFVVTWIGFWFNIPGVTLNPTEEANTLFDSGSDVVISGIDTTEALQVASQRAASGEAVYASPFDYVGACEEAPDACVGVPYYNWGPAYVRLVEAVRDGTWEQDWIWEPPSWEDMNNLDVSPIGFAKGGGLSEGASAQLDEFIAEMSAFGSDPENEGRIFLWEGPLNYQDGTELAPEGEFVDPLHIWFLPQLLEGMVGASE